MSTRTESAHDGAISLLLWRAVQDAAQKNLIFDFDGFNTRDSVAFFAGFGGRVSPRYMAVKTSLLGWFVWEAKELRRPNRHLC